MQFVCFAVFVVDRVEIGLLKVTDATGRRRLNETITHLTDVIAQGLTGTVDNFRYGVTSLSRCASGNGIGDGCSNGTVVATGQPDLSPDLSDSATGRPDIRDSATFINRMEAGDCIKYWLLAIMAVYIITYS